MVGYFPIDGPSVPPNWINAIQKLTIPIAYSKYAKKIVCGVSPELQNKYMPVIYHGIDFDVMCPVPDAQREAVRKKSNLTDKFVIGIVNRFQPRKQVGLGIKAFALFYYGYKECSCGNFYLSRMNECDLCFGSNVVAEHPAHPEALAYLHMNPIEPLIGGDTNTLFMIMNCAGLLDDDIIKCVMMPANNIYGPNAPTPKDLNLRYNMLDCYVATDCGEGFGLTQMEALSVGIPVIKAHNSTSDELLGGHGRIVPSKSFFTMSHDSGHFRPAVDIPSLVREIESVYDEWIKNDRKTKTNWHAHEYVRKNFSWDNRAMDFHEQILKSAQINQHQRMNPKLQWERI
jgi:glycosyltransferase involved in cell wall biosynthesis